MFLCSFALDTLYERVSVFPVPWVKQVPFFLILKKREKKLEMESHVGSAGLDLDTVTSGD